MAEFDSLCVLRPLLGQVCRGLIVIHCVRVCSGHVPRAARAGIPGHSVSLGRVCVSCSTFPAQATK